MEWIKTSQPPKRDIENPVLAYDMDNRIYSLVLITSYQDMDHLEKCYDYWMKLALPESED